MSCISCTLGKNVFFNYCYYIESKYAHIHDVHTFTKQNHLFLPSLALSASIAQCLPSSPSLPSNSIFETIFFFSHSYSVSPIFLSSLLAPDHSRSEMDLSAPGSEPSDDAFSLRSRSVPGLNQTVSSINLCLLPPSAACLHTDHILDLLQIQHGPQSQLKCWV